VTSIAVVGSSAIRSRGRESHRDHGALPQPARELPRVGVDARLGHRDADAAEQIDGHPARFAPGEPRSGPSPLALVEPERLGDLIADRVDGAEGRHRLLGNQRDLGAPNGAHRGALRREPGQVDGRGRILTKEDLARDDPTGRLDDLQDGLHGHALPAPALADDSDHLAGTNIEAHAVDRPHDALVEEKMDPQILDLENGRRHWL